ncbi:MAG: protein phosphatase 2C domain-containing protein [Anaerolineae bacterium]|jgi:serine/threonine protein phosphatase PrpC|nr:protein phosphatase 2C domain-containing protein [Anaerolineae bacterium]
MSQAPEWRVTGASVRGAAHVRAALPNQDAILWWPDGQTGPPLILVVSDGHGSDKSFRSDVGSRLAVECAAALLRELLLIQPAAKHLSAIKRALEERLPLELVKDWRSAVDVDLAAAPFTEAELARVEQRRGPAGRQEVVENPRLAYGATLLAAVVAQEFIAYLQLGDGDILTIARDGAVMRPFAHDARLIANETTSLCMEHAAREVRIRFQAAYGEEPALILLATDGYANSFVNEEAFLKVGTDLLDILREDGATVVAGALPGWLEDASTAGSGDDISLGILFRGDIQVSADAPADDGAPEIADTSLLVESSRPSHKGATAAEPESTDEGAQRSRFVARIKQRGPTEPSKRGRLADLGLAEAGASDAGHAEGDEGA